MAIATCRGAVERCAAGLTLLLLLALAAVPALPCTCSSSEPLRACELFTTAPVIFRGRVIEHNGASPGLLSAATYYRVEVVEAFKGIASNIHEVLIDPDNGSSCKTRYTLNSEYLFYTGTNQQHPTAASLRSSGRNIRFPEKWTVTPNTPVLRDSACSPTRAARDAAPDLLFLRAAVQANGAIGSWIEGRAAQNREYRYPAARFPALSDASFVFTGSDGRTHTARTGSDGNFVLPNVRPGKYTVTASSPTLGAGKLNESTLDVPAHGCSVGIASFASRASVSGRVVHADGSPAGGTQIVLAEMLPDGSVRRVPGASASTKERTGEFTIPNAPTTPFVLVSNLAGVPSHTEPWDRTYTPGTRSLKAATIFRVQPGQQITGATLRLPRPYPVGDLLVNVRWSDGRPATNGAHAQAKLGDEVGDSANGANGSAQVRLRLVLNRSWKVTADWRQLRLRQDSLYAPETKPRTVQFTHSGQTITITLPTARPQIR